MPIPIIDGGPILKWSLVEQGKSIKEADQALQKINGIMGIGLGAASISAAKRKRRVWSAIFAMFSLSALGVALGLWKEQA